MQPDITSLNEVVVIGYGEKKRALVTGANIRQDGKALQSLNTPSAMEALQGITPGVSISRNSGQPGAGTRVRIRGIGTNGNSEPLYIVDGVPVGNDINYLAPSDIESIDVLKDAASAAIYGARGANGVILVTTRKGKQGSNAQITYNGYTGVQNIYRKPPAQNLGIKNFQTVSLPSHELSHSFSQPVARAEGKALPAGVRRKVDGTTCSSVRSTHSLHLEGYPIGRAATQRW